MEDASSPATLTGTVLAPMLCPSPLDVVEGTFVLLERHPEEVDTDWMRYRMKLRSRTEPSQTFFLDGHKVINVGFHPGGLEAHDHALRHDLHR